MAANFRNSIDGALLRQVSRIIVSEILRRFPAAYDSRAVSVIVLRVLKGHDVFRIAHIQTMISRRTESNQDWEKEDTAVLVAATFNHLDTLRVLVVPHTSCVMNSPPLPKGLILDVAQLEKIPRKPLL